MSGSMYEDADDDLALLRQYEPVICYTLGELYFPCSVEEYVKRSSLWMRSRGSDPVLLHNWGELTLEKIAQYNEIPDKHSLYLRFVDEPMDVLEYSRWRMRPDLPAFYAPGRLARVGIFPRIIDSLFDLSLLIRGNVPGGTTAAAERKFEDICEADPRRIYYGRVLRIGGYTILHYLFFYAMNDWRSTFHGVNDHEGDWEQIFVYLSGPSGELVPRWVAYASHDYEGDELRRRWDDPVLRLVDGKHPTVYAGAGSHASYFMPGEYLMSVEPAPLHPVQRTIDWISNFWSKNLKQGAERAPEDENPTQGIVSVPFVDYARGDGSCIGPGQEEGWTPILISDEMPWVDHYRGLWGLDTDDPWGGERAPSGPKYNRNGSIRKSWYDPLGWAGLDKVTPPESLAPELEERIEDLRNRGRELDAEIRRQREKLRRSSLEVAALTESEFVSAIEAQRRESLDQEESALHELYSERIRTLETRRAVEAYLKQVQAGDLGDPHGHLRSQHLPAPPLAHTSWALEWWSAISGALLLLLVAAVVILRPPYWIWWLVGAGFVIFALEATVRGFLSQYLLNISILLAIISVVLLLYEFWWLAILGAIVALAAFMIRENVRELRFGNGSKTQVPAAPEDAGNVLH
ncbi:MAG: hypothetical protein ACK2UO_03155 [Caldilineaceae bacterium]|jgi:hypothetical protein